MLEGKLRAELYEWLKQWKDDEVIISVDYNGDWDLFNELMYGYDMPWILAQNVNGCIDEVLAQQYFTDTGLLNHHALHDAYANRFAFREPQDVGQ